MKRTRRGCHGDMPVANCSTAEYTRADQVSFQMIECFSTTAASCNMIRCYKDILKVARNGVQPQKVGKIRGPVSGAEVHSELPGGLQYLRWST